MLLRRVSCVCCTFPCARARRPHLFCLRPFPTPTPSPIRAAMVLRVLDYRAAPSPAHAIYNAPSTLPARCSTAHAASAQGADGLNCVCVCD
ncbi:MAG: hypothetical protein J3K34DRAFT_427217 [Monoraphidium minutum]|nr:MAG: hypothetical protein J3K34DRAFT_427217 [Monoraphidium minutum]